MPYEQERRIAELAIQRAALLTKNVFDQKAKGEFAKDDRSPVTIGDFGAQALVLQALLKNFPKDQICAEEESSSLRENKSLSAEIWDLVKDIKLEDKANDELLGRPPSEEAMLDIIDQGKSPGGPEGRLWALDPIDGTKGFLRGGQYAICLALIEDGDVKVGAIACPNLAVDGSLHSEDASRGILLSAVKGSGAISRPLSAADLSPGKPISMRPVPDVSQATFCESVEAGHSNQGGNAAVAKLLGIASPSVRLDSQAKYCSIAMGVGDIYLRLPARIDYEEKIWDHAAGDLIVQEAGGKVTDIYGKPLDFSKGRTLAANKGVVAASKLIQGQVIDAVQAVLHSK
jgi:3'(2'), 5'-bisphosphate nucleotidase